MQTLTNIRGLIFDYGGTLDTGGRHWAWVIRDGYTKAGIHLPDDIFRQAYVHGERTLAAQPIIQPNDTFAVLLDKKINIQLNYLAQQGALSLNPAERSKAQYTIVTHCDDVARTHTQRASFALASLLLRFPIALASNFYGNLSTVLSAYNLHHCFTTVVESALVGVRKPSPDLFRIALDRLSLPPAQVLVVGDSVTNDIIPAQSLGCPTAWLQGQGWTDAIPTLPSPPTFTLTHLQELTSCLA